MGLGRLLTTRKAPEPVANRVITEFNFGRGVMPSDALGSGRHYKGAMGLPGAWRAANLAADLLGSIPWHAYRERGDRPVERLDPVPPLLDQPAPPETRMTTFSSWALDLLWHGNAISLVAARNFEGWPTAVLPVPAEAVAVRRVGPQATSDLPVGTIEYRIGDRSYTPDDVIHIKGPCEPSALRGMGVLEVHLDTLRLADDQGHQARSVSRNSGVPTGILKSSNEDLSKEEAQDLKASWLDSQRSRTIAVLNATTDFTPLAWSPQESQLVEARTFSLHELALIFGLDPSWLGAAQASRTYSNLEMESANLIRFSMRGHLARFEQALSLAFPRGTRVQADLSDLLRADTLTRYQAHQIGLTAGFLTLDEVREIENRAPLPVPPDVETEQPEVETP